MATARIDDAGVSGEIGVPCATARDKTRLYDE
jgi:hypothetical protein